MPSESIDVGAINFRFNQFSQNFFASDVPRFVKQAEARDETKLIAKARAFTEVRPGSFRRDLLV
jgi:hypothetical protein